MSIKLFESKQIRSLWNEEDQKWYFSVIDVIEILTESSAPRRYWSDLKKRLEIEGSEVYAKFVQLKLKAPDGKMRLTDVADTEQLLRLIQSVPSPKAEPFKVWLAKVGYERMQEIENPELAAQRTRHIYKAKGYSDEWIEKRIRGIAVRDELTNEWSKRGVKEGLEYSILTAEISNATFGLIPSDYKNLKGLTKASDNLRDHMTDVELIFTMLGEASTAVIATSRDAKGFEENQDAAKLGGNVAGSALKDLERKSGKKVVSPVNFKTLTQSKSKKLE